MYIVVLCGDRFESVVKPCWAENPSARPDFNTICARIEQFRCAPTGEDYYTRGQSDSGETYANVDEYDEYAFSF